MKINASGYSTTEQESEKPQGTTSTSVHVKLESADSGGERNVPQLGESRWTGLLPAFRDQSLQLGELKRLLPRPRVRESSGSQILGAAGAEVQAQPESAAAARSRSARQTGLRLSRGSQRLSFSLSPGSFHHPTRRECSD